MCSSQSSSPLQPLQRIRDAREMAWGIKLSGKVVNNNGQIFFSAVWHEVVRTNGARLHWYGGQLTIDQIQTTQTPPNVKSPVPLNPSSKAQPSNPIFCWNLIFCLDRNSGNESSSLLIASKPKPGKCTASSERQKIGFLKTHKTASRYLFFQFHQKEQWPLL